MVRRRERRRRRESAQNPAKFSNEKKEGEDFTFCRRTDDVEERNRETEEEEEEEEDESDCVELSSQQRCVNSARSITHGETITSPVRATETLLGLRLSVRFNDFKRTLERL